MRPEGLDRRRPAAHPDMSLHVAIGEIGDGGLGRRRGRRGVEAALDAVDHRRRPAPRRLGRQVAAIHTQREALRPSGRASGLDAPDLAARGMDADAEAGQVAVPHHGVARLHGERVDNAPGELDGLPRGHGGAPFPRRRIAVGSGPGRRIAVGSGPGRRIRVSNLSSKRNRLERYACPRMSSKVVQWRGGSRAGSLASGFPMN